MEGSFYALISRMRYIRRWGLMRNSYDENLSEHSHMTAVLAHALAVIRRDVMGRPADPDKAASAALFHDAAEIITGDLPTPVKYHSREITGAYKQVERAAELKLLALLPDAMQPAYDDAMCCPDDGVRELVKAADKLAAYIKCIEERGAGNGEFRSAEAQIRAALDASALPEVHYFMAHFLPAFGQTLDELTQNETGGTK